MIAVTTASRIADYQIVAYKGTAKGPTFGELLNSAEPLGADAILNSRFDNALDVDTFFHGAAVVLGPIPKPLRSVSGEGPVLVRCSSCENKQGPN